MTFRGMTKINLDKYYTPADLAEYCVKKTKEIIGKENITEWLEPSAGAGVFLPYLDNNYLAFDIEPEAENIEQANYLELDLPYLKGRCVIGNPPFGERNALVKKFYNQAILQGDYVAFILPITQLENTQSLYKLKLVYSEDLGVTKYSDRDVHCCFNIYKRNDDGTFCKKVDYSIDGIEIVEYKRTKEVDFDRFDFAVCTWGNGCCGKIPEYKGQYAQEHYIIVHNKSIREEVIDVCNRTDWKNEVAPKNTSAKKIQTWRIYKYLREQIPQLI